MISYNNKHIKQTKPCCLFLFREFNDVIFEHCPRESNFAAHVVAREAVDDSQLWKEDPPDFIVDVIANNVFVFPKLIHHGWRGLSPISMLEDFRVVRRWVLADSTASDGNRGTMFTQVHASEVNILHPTCLILYCWYNLELLQWWRKWDLAKAMRRVWRERERERERGSVRD
jgi:hypothetical protein